MDTSRKRSSDDTRQFIGGSDDSPGSTPQKGGAGAPPQSSLGAKPVFDAMDDCYGALAPHFSGVEPGLSSPPPMNWRVSSLD
ncbi:MAG: hypothetical protein OXC08_17730, partial [Thiotrichales bacterium]|nr:hypothetical protein [Thiotrichales bacterium]